MKFDFGFGPGGGIGDMIVSLPILDHLIEHIGPYANIHILGAKNIDIYKTLLGPRVDQIYKIYKGDSFTDTGEHVEYHGVLRTNELCNFTVVDGENKRIAINEELAKLTPKFVQELEIGLERISIFGPMATHLPFINNGLANLAVKLGLNRVTLPQWSIGMDEFKYPRLYAKPRIIGLPSQYITFNDGWQANQPKPTKSYNHWKELLPLLPLPVVQLGNAETGNSYSNCLSLRGKLSFSEGLSVLAGSACHIDIEGGLVHAAHAMGTPCVVLHGPTNVQFFGYPTNQNLINGTCANCWWLTNDWNINCVAKIQTCMNHRPEIIAEAVNNVLTT